MEKTNSITTLKFQKNVEENMKILFAANVVSFILSLPIVFYIGFIAFNYTMETAPTDFGWAWIVAGIIALVAGIVVLKIVSVILALFFFVVFRSVYNFWK